MSPFEKDATEVMVKEGDNLRRAEDIGMEPLVERARAIVRRLGENFVRDFFELGKVVAEAQNSGYSLRVFAEKVGVNHVDLSYARRFYEKYGGQFENVPVARLPTLRAVKEDTVNSINTETGAIETVSVSPTPVESEPEPELDGIEVVGSVPETVECPTCRGRGRIPL